MKYFLFWEVLLKKSITEHKQMKNKIKHKDQGKFCMAGLNQKYILCLFVFFSTATIKSLSVGRKSSPLVYGKVHSL